MADRYGKLPSSDTQEYLWWSQGAADEARTRDEGMSPAGRELRDVLEAWDRLAMSRDSQPPSLEHLVTTLARIYCPRRLRRRHRV